MRSSGALNGQGVAFLDVDDESLEEWFCQLYRAFGIDISCDSRLREFVKAVFTGERVIGVRDAEGYVATAAAVGTSLSLPGSTEIDVLCLTGLTVDTTWRRQGILRTAMDSLHRHAIENGIAATVLSPSQWPIYSRFGYGPAVWFDDVAVDARVARWRDDAPGLDGEIRRIGGEEAGRLAKAIYESRWRVNPGDIRPPHAYWSRFEHGSSCNRIDELLGLSSNDAVVRHCTAVSDDGVVAYRLKPGWTAESTPEYVLEITDLLSSDMNAEALLWRHVLSVDLAAEVRSTRIPVDHPLRWWLNDARLIRAKRHDGLWLRPLNVEVLLSLRKWNGSDAVTLCVRDEDGIASGMYALEVNEGDASCVRISDQKAPDLEMDVSALGAIALGGTSARSLAASGAIRVKELRIAQRWDALATPERSPFTRYPL